MRVAETITTPLQRGCTITACREFHLSAAGKGKFLYRRSGIRFFTPCTKNLSRNLANAITPIQELPAFSSASVIMVTSTVKVQKMAAWRLKQRAGLFLYGKNIF